MKRMGLISLLLAGWMMASACGDSGGGELLRNDKTSVEVQAGEAQAGTVQSGEPHIQETQPEGTVSGETHAQETQPEGIVSEETHAQETQPAKIVSGETQSEQQIRTSFDFVRDMGVGINLGNTLDAYWLDESNLTGGGQIIGSDCPCDYETCWGQPYTTREMIAGMKREGFGNIRIPVYWGNSMAEDGTYSIDEQWMERVAELVDIALENNLYVVINIHHYDEFLIKHHSREECVSAAKILWRQIAERFRDYPEQLIFEGYNENLGTIQNGTYATEEERYSYVNEMNRVFVDSVRATGGENAERMLIVSGYWTNIDKTVDERFLLPEDSAEDRLMVSVHYVDNECYWGNRVGGDYWISYCEEQCRLLQERFVKQGIPVFVGECTAIYDNAHLEWGAKYQNSAEILEMVLQKIAESDMVPVLWDTGEFYRRDSAVISSEENREVIRKVTENIQGERKGA